MILSRINTVFFALIHEIFKVIKKLLPAAVLIISAALCGCESTFDDSQPISGPFLSGQEWNAQKLILVDVQKYKVNGSMILDLIPRTNYGSNTNTRGSASFLYSRSGTDYTFTVTHALAGQLLKIRKSKEAGGIELTGSEGNQYRFSSEREFMEAVSLPVDRMPYMIMGVTFGDESETRYDESGRLAYQVVDGWRIRYYEYGRFGDFVLPSKLKLENVSVGTIKITVKGWNFTL